MRRRTHRTRRPLSLLRGARSLPGLLFVVLAVAGCLDLEDLPVEPDFEPAELLYSVGVTELEIGWALNVNLQVDLGRADGAVRQLLDSSVVVGPDLVELSARREEGRVWQGNVTRPMAQGYSAGDPIEFGLPIADRVSGGFAVSFPGGTIGPAVDSGGVVRIPVAWPKPVDGGGGADSTFTLQGANWVAKVRVEGGGPTLIVSGLQESPDVLEVSRSLLGVNPADGEVSLSGTLELTATYTGTMADGTAFVVIVLREFSEIGFVSR